MPLGPIIANLQDWPIPAHYRVDILLAMTEVHVGLSVVPEEYYDEVVHPIGLSIVIENQLDPNDVRIILSVDG
jgi:hypothetical protein